MPTAPNDPATDSAPVGTSDRQPTRWAGIAPADRRAERRTLLLDAAFDLLGTEGWPGTTVRAVCQRARLNPRYFYESFDDLDALVVAVYDRLVGEMTATIMAAGGGAGDDTAAQTRAQVLAIARQTAELVELGRAITEDDLVLLEDYAYPAYGVPSAETICGLKTVFIMPRPASADVAGIPSGRTPTRRTAPSTDS